MTCADQSGLGSHGHPGQAIPNWTLTLLHLTLLKSTPLMCDPMPIAKFPSIALAFILSYIVPLSSPANTPARVLVTLSESHGIIHGWDWLSLVLTKMLFTLSSSSLPMLREVTIVASSYIVEF